jgi:hypothetical protein
MSDNTMTDNTIALIAALLDRSGSMQSIAADMRGGFDAYIANEHAQSGTTLVTLAQFDDEYEVVYQNRDAGAVPPLALEPRGCTALLDSIGRFVIEVGSGLAALPADERPGDITVLVMTDGFENASTEWNVEAVRALISQQETVYSWDFVFLGANMDAVDVGTNLGFAPGKSLTWDASEDGVEGAFAAVAGYSDRKRSRGDVPLGSIVFDESERRRANRQQ